MKGRDDQIWGVTVKMANELGAQSISQADWYNYCIRIEIHSCTLQNHKVHLYSSEDLSKSLYITKIKPY